MRQLKQELDVLRSLRVNYLGRGIMSTANDVTMKRETSFAWFVGCVRLMNLLILIALIGTISKNNEW